MTACCQWPHPVGAGVLGGRGSRLAAAEEVLQGGAKARRADRLGEERQALLARAAGRRARCSSVRGYPLREVVNDRGYAGQLELYTPPLSERYQARLSAFYDFGSVRRNRALPGETVGDSISSAGLGARAGYGKALSVRFDLARVRETTANRRDGSVRLGLAAAYQF